MADQRGSGINWTDQTWNPVRGCTRVSQGCTNCYAERMAARFSGLGEPYEGLAKNTPQGPRWTGEVKLIPEHLRDPLRWQKPRRIFVNSMSDLFHEKLSDEAIAAVFGIMAAAGKHTFQVLTKRPDRMSRWFVWLDQMAERCASIFPDDSLAWRRAHVLSSAALRNALGLASSERKQLRAGELEARGWPLPNVWLGTTTEDQPAAEKRVPHLLETPAVVRFLSVEPMLGPVDLANIDVLAGLSCAADLPPHPRIHLNAFTGHLCGPDEFMGARIHWVICGGESGPRARRMDPTWAEDVAKQCATAHVAFHFKQLGDVLARERGFDSKGADLVEVPEALRVREFPASPQTPAVAVEEVRHG
jgi:protein gp37